jgi:hypothetical protein
MPSVDDTLTELGRLAETPLVPAPPIEHVAAAARRVRRRRRRFVAGAVTLVAAASLSTWGIVRAGDDGATRIETAQSVTSTAPAPAPTTVAGFANRDVTAEPATDLEDGSVVTVTFARPPNATLAAQCAADAVATSTPDTAWCDVNVAPTATADPLQLTFTVSRVIETSHGLVDCATAEEPCVIGAYAADDGRPMYAALAFRTDLEPIAPATVTIDRDAPVDGDIVHVEGTGFRAGEDVFVSECTTIEWDDCDVARSSSLVADAQGAFAIEFRASYEILTYDGWQVCEPCIVRASAFRVEPAVVPMTVRAGNDPRRPSVRIVEPGPYDREQRVTLEGAGFQFGASLAIGWCPFEADTEYPICLYPNEGFLTVGPDGTFTRADFPMPKAAFGPCDATRRCALATHPFEGSPASFETDFELR